MIATVLFPAPPNVTRDFSLSNASLICWRVIVFEPRSNMLDIIVAAVFLLKSDFSSRKAQRHARAHGVAARGLGEQRELHTVGQRRADRARVDVRWRRIKRLARRERRVSLVVLRHRHDVRVGHLRNLARSGLLGRVEQADRPVVRLEICRGHALHVSRRHFLHAVAVHVHETPVAGRRPLRERRARPRPSCSEGVSLLEQRRFCALDFFSRRGGLPPPLPSSESESPSRPPATDPFSSSRCRREKSALSAGC